MRNIIVGFIVASNLVACATYRVQTAPGSTSIGKLDSVLVTPGRTDTTNKGSLAKTDTVRLPRTPVLGLSQNYTLIDRPMAQSMLEQFACASSADSAAFALRMRTVEDSLRLHVAARDYHEQLRRDTLVLNTWNRELRDWMGKHQQQGCKYRLGEVSQRVIVYSDTLSLPRSSLRTHRDNTARIGENTGFRVIPKGWHSREDVVKEANDPKVQDRIKMCAARNHIDPNLTQEYVDSLKAGNFQWIPATGVAAYNLPCGDMPWGRNIAYFNDRGEPVIYMALVTVHNTYGATKIGAFGSCANMWFPAQSVEFSIPRTPLPQFASTPPVWRLKQDTTEVPPTYETKIRWCPGTGGKILCGALLAGAACYIEHASHSNIWPCGIRRQELIQPETGKPVGRPGNCTTAVCDRSPIGGTFQPYKGWTVNDQPIFTELPTNRRTSTPIAQITIPW